MRRSGKRRRKGHGIQEVIFDKYPHTALYPGFCRKACRLLSRKRTLLDPCTFSAGGRKGPRFCAASRTCLLTELIRGSFAWGLVDERCEIFLPDRMSALIDWRFRYPKSKRHRASDAFDVSRSDHLRRAVRRRVGRRYGDAEQRRLPDSLRPCARRISCALTAVYKKNVRKRDLSAFRNEKKRGRIRI